MVRENATHPVAPSDLGKLSSTEIMTGVLLFTESRKFPEQALYELFRVVGSEDAALGRKFRVASDEGRLHSEPLRRILDHLEMGKIIEVPLPNPVDQFYALRASQSETVQEDLRERGVLPAYEARFKELGSRFRKIIQEFKDRSHSASPRPA